jgi:deoxyribonuclease V
LLATAVVVGAACAPYDAGHLALREGSLLERAVRTLERSPEVLLVDSTGRDHPRRAGMALHLGARLRLPTVGVTNRLLSSTGPFPADTLHARSAFGCEGEIAGWWVRTRPGTRPLAVHAAWRTDARTALAVVLACTGRERTPAPLRLARQAAREARTRESMQR